MFVFDREEGILDKGRLDWAEFNPVPDIEKSGISLRDLFASEFFRGEITVGESWAEFFGFNVRLVVGVDGLI